MNLNNEMFLAGDAAFRWWKNLCDAYIRSKKKLESVTAPNNCATYRYAQEMSFLNSIKFRLYIIN